MNEPDCPSKRLKMDEASSGGPSTSVEIFSGLDHAFCKIRRRLGFVDHTPLIEVFLETRTGTGIDFSPTRIFVSAPSHFCKSSNMDMARQFFQINNDGTIEDKLEERRMYATFEDTAIMRNTERQILEKHFCAHPVVFLDLRIDSVTDVYDAESHFFKAIRKAYEDNKVFLEKHLPSEGTHIDECRQWWKASKWTGLGSTSSVDLENGLKTLVESLFIAHEGKRVLLLIDECDAVLRGALTCGVQSEETHLNNVKAQEESMKAQVDNIATELDSIAVSVKLKMSRKKESDSDITRLLNGITKLLSSNKTVEGLGRVARSLLNIVEALSCYKEQEEKLEAIVAELKDKSLQAKLEKRKEKCLEAKLEKRNHLEAIARLIEGVLGKVTKGDILKNLHGALFTGISYISGIGFSEGIKVEPRRFLDDKGKFGNLICKYHGLSIPKLDDLLKNLKNKEKIKESEEKKKIIRKYYNGYYTRNGKPILSLWSVLHYLNCNDKNATTYNQMGYIGKIYKKAFFSPLVGEIILNLINGGETSFEYVQNVTLAELVYLRDKGVKDETTRNILLSLLMEVGFLANVPPKSPTGGDGENVWNEEDDIDPEVSKNQECAVVVIIPNEEIKNVFQHMMKFYDIPFGPFKFEVILPCADALHEVRHKCLSSDEILYKERLKVFHEKLENLFEGFKVYKDDELNESGLQSLMWFTFTYPGKYKVISEKRVGDGRVDLWLKDEKEEFYIIFELKLNRGDWKHCSSRYALKQIKGEEGSNINYTVDLEEKKFLLVGLSMNKEGKASICVQTSEGKHPILVSKTEQQFLCYHKDYYKECYDLINDKMIPLLEANSTL